MREVSIDRFGVLARRVLPLTIGRDVSARDSFYLLYFDPCFTFVDFPGVLFHSRDVYRLERLSEIEDQGFV